MKVLAIMLWALFMGSATVSYAAGEPESGEAPSEVVTAEDGEEEEEEPGCD